MKRLLYRAAVVAAVAVFVVVAGGCEQEPYAGGVAGYNSGGDITNPTADTEATIENCYSTATVNAESTSKTALAGGIAGANACRARISKHYATGAVTAQVAGNSEATVAGWGVMPAILVIPNHSFGQLLEDGQAAVQDDGKDDENDSVYGRQYPAPQKRKARWDCWRFLFSDAYQTPGLAAGPVTVTSSPDGSMTKKPFSSAYSLSPSFTTVAANAP
jgi:hypothetical protein